MHRPSFSQILFAVFLFCFFAACSTHKNAVYNKPQNELFQYSLITALQKGIFETTDFTVRDLKKEGNFGLGTFNQLDGELILSGNTVYRAGADGSVSIVADETGVPFANAVYFKTEKRFVLQPTHALSQKALYDSIHAYMKPNQLYAVRVSGTFDTLKFRSVPKQQRPYPSLSDAAKNQSVFEMSGISGTLQGFYTPAFLSSINVAEFHFHFLNNEHNKGGHMLAFSTGKPLLVELALLPATHLRLPDNADFNKARLQEINQADIYKAEH